MTVSLSISEVNDLPSDHFIKIFGNIVEHYPAAAIGILKKRPFKCVDNVSEAVGYYLENLNQNVVYNVSTTYTILSLTLERKKILQLHPDIAGKLAESGNLTKESTAEQASCGLQQATHEQKIKLNQLNELYRSKFGFPFVICARENKLQTILLSIENRLSNNLEEEVLNGIQEVKKISKLRILQIINK